MNGPQDLGGQMGFGPVAPERDEPYFHAEWEKRALGLTLCAGAMGAWNLDESRHARESLHPAIYYAASYYEIWIRALEVLLQRHGFVSAADLAAGDAVDPAAVPKRVLKAGDVAAVLVKGGPCDRPIGGATLAEDQLCQRRGQVGGGRDAADRAGLEYRQQELLGTRKDPETGNRPCEGRHVFEHAGRILHAGDDRAMIYGAMIWMANKLNSEDGDRARELWAGKGKEAFATERTASVHDRTHPPQDRA